ncbi:unnamed protein product [Peniophora sp. CBMAI 1063]|nr:unnamed protein product [Peniophora sp. CBMAI 1063]
MKDPVGAIQTLRRLHRETPIGQENNELYEWADKFLCVLAVDQDWAQEPQRRLVRADLANVCLDIIMRADFWQSHWYFCMPILRSTAMVVQLTRKYKDPKVVQVLNGRAKALWRSVWERKTQWKSLLTHADRQENHQEPLVQLLSGYGNLYIDQGQLPYLNTYMPHVGLHAWLQYGDDGPVLEPIRNAVMGLMAVDQEACRKFFRDEGISGAVAEKVVSKIKQEFVRSDSAQEFVHLSPFLFTFTNCRELFPFYEPYSLIHEVSTLLDRLCAGVGTREEKLTSANTALTYISEYSATAQDVLSGKSTGRLGIDGGDLVHIFATGVLLLASDGGGRVENNIDADVCEKLENLIGGWTIRDMEEASALLRSFQNDVTSCARSEWWPSLQRLQITIRRAGPNVNASRLKRLAKSWVAFGTALGLIIDQERTRHREAMRSRCSWVECKYHRENIGDVVLSTCKGCGEVKYCGRECQRNDWSKGGHKAYCKRIKA